MTPLCKVEVTLPGVRGAWGVRGDVEELRRSHIAGKNPPEAATNL